MNSKLERTLSPLISRAAGGVTVAIACYNQGRFLQRCITSVLEETRPPEQIVLVDDGSTDDTRTVAGMFEAVRYVFQENAGLPAARNTALRLATEPRILFLDADDWLAPAALEAASAAFEAAAMPPALAHGSYHEVSEDERILSTHIARHHADPFLQLLRSNYIAMHGTVLYDTALLRASGGFDTSLRSCEDYDVLLRLARDHPIAAYPQIAANYRRHGHSLSRDRLAMIDTALRVIDRHLKSSPRTRRHVDSARAGRRFMTRYYVRQIFSDLRQARDRGRLWSAVGRLMLSAGRRPAVLGQVLRSSLPRIVRAPRITG